MSFYQTKYNFIAGQTGTEQLIPFFLGQLFDWAKRLMYKQAID